MKKNFSPGELIWCADGGDVKQVEVTIERGDMPAGVIINNGRH